MDDGGGVPRTVVSGGQRPRRQWPAVRVRDFQP